MNSDLRRPCSGAAPNRRATCTACPRRRGDRIVMLFAAVRSDANGSVSRVSPVHTAMRNCTRDEGGPLEIGNQVLISSHRKLLSSKAMVVSVAETAGQDLVRQG